jgi:hypothetical protein
MIMIQSYSIILLDDFCMHNYTNLKKFKQCNLTVSKKKVNTIVISPLMFNPIIFRDYTKTIHASRTEDARFSHVSSNKVCTYIVLPLYHNIRSYYYVVVNNVIKLYLILWDGGSSSKAMWCSNFCNYM